MVGFASLPIEVVQHIYSFLDGVSCGRSCVVHSTWRTALCEDKLWKQYFMREIMNLDEPLDSDLQTKSSFRDAYVHWMTSFNGEERLLVARAARLWYRMMGWLEGNIGEVASTVLRGASERDLDEVETQLDVTLPPAVRAVYRVRNGQATQFDRAMDRAIESGTALRGDQSMLHGMLGGYTFYNHSVNTRLLSTQRIVTITHYIRQHVPIQQLPPHIREAWPRMVVVATSYKFDPPRFTLLDTRDGSLHVTGASMECLHASHPPTHECHDGMLRWLEAYSDALSSGMFNVAQAEDGTRYIQLFAEKPPFARCAVTRGVKVKAASLFIPELSARNRLYFFAYNVTFSYAANDEMVEGEAPVQRAQLTHRHWTIRDANGDIVDQVDGEGVVGLHPLVAPGKEAVSYQSCTRDRHTDGSMEGSFTFVEGTMAAPTGPGFEAECPRFFLSVPDFIF